MTTLQFQSTSSEEDVVSLAGEGGVYSNKVSIHVLRRGRCVPVITLPTALMVKFQSTSSEEDVVSLITLALSRTS